MPRAGLSTGRVIAEAGDLADEIGYEDLTLAAVADRVGVRLPSLYRHVAGAAELRRQLAIASKRELGQVLAEAAPGQDGRPALRAAAVALRSWARAHPGRFAATRRAPDADDEQDRAASAGATEALLGLLSGYGLRGDELIDAARGLRAALDGFVTIETAGGFGLDRSVDASFDWLIDAFDRRFRDQDPG